MSKTKEYWIVHDWLGNGPTLGSAQGRVTAQSLILSGKDTAFGYARRLPLSDAHDTPAKALAAWDAARARDVSSAQAALDRALAAQALAISC